MTGNLFAQYKGSPVKKERLIQALRSRQFQARDIVVIINSNGVDFPLTPETRRSLIAAGARPEVIQAISANLRIPKNGDSLVARAEKNNKPRRIKPVAPDYDDLLDRAIYSYKEQRNPQNAVQILQTAARVNPQNPAAYQMLGFVYLYGLNDFAQAEKSMQESFANGGSAVFRVYHDDNGKFSKRCTGSLYISQHTMRFESDDNVHTFETLAVNVDKIKLDTESTKGWKKHSIFKVILKFGKEEAKFRFAPLTGDLAVSRMVERFISSANSNISPAGTAKVSTY
jgi:tetratricopeptide (TPR) repeat protein